MNYFRCVMETLREEILAAGRDNPSEDLLAAYTLTMLVRGTELTGQDIHNAWAAARIFTRPGHPDLVPWSQLTEANKDRDQRYVPILVRAWARVVAHNMCLPQVSDPDRYPATFPTDDQ